MASLHERAGEVFLAVWKPCWVGMWLAVAMALPVDLRAQTTTATVRGKAADEQGAALPGVTVTARQVDTNTSLSVTSSDVGQYFLPNLPPGRYEVSAELKGFRIERRTDLVLQLGQELTIDFTLKVEGLQEVVVVGANAPILETTKNTVGTIITKDEIDDLPTWSVTSARSPGSRQASRRASEETATACP